MTTDPSLPQVSILVVDDRQDNLVALDAILEPLGQRVVRARSGNEAIAAVGLERFAVILMDIRMPGLDGFETMAVLRQRPHSRHVPIIFLSASPEQQDGLRSYASGAVDYLMKPINAGALRSKVSTFVQLRQNELALESARAELEVRVAQRTAELASANRALAAEIVERKAAEQRLYERAFHDELTGLANRALFGVHLERALARSRRNQSGFAVLMMDLDRFKIVNDSLGHLGGDALLVGVAKRLTESLREVDTVARLGGDEFAILLDETADESDALRLAERIRSRLEAPFAIDGREVFASASIGIAVLSGRYQRGEDLVRDADAAMYRAKEAGGARCQLFDVRMHDTLLEQLELEAALRRAVEREQLVLHYQPIVNLVSGRVDRVEALLRWRHPTRGLLGPLEFISLSEDTGLIYPIGKWVLDRACKQLAAWRREGLRHLGMNVNVSPRQFANTRLLADVDEAARAAGIDPAELTLEVTESAVMPSSKDAGATLDDLRALGVQISLDDFGTGHSCLGYLHRFPVTSLKIDRSFVSRVDSAENHEAIVRAIMSLADNLKLSVVAEGVETVAQRDRLGEMGCERAQGFLFSQPLEPGDVPRAVRDFEQRRAS